MKKTICILLCLLIPALLFAGCSNDPASAKAADKALSLWRTISPR